MNTNNTIEVAEGPAAKRQRRNIPGVVRYHHWRHRAKALRDIKADIGLATSTDDPGTPAAWVETKQAWDGLNDVAQQGFQEQSRLASLQSTDSLDAIIVSTDEQALEVADSDDDDDDGVADPSFAALQHPLQANACTSILPSVGLLGLVDELGPFPITEACVEHMCSELGSSVRQLGSTWESHYIQHYCPHKLKILYIFQFNAYIFNGYIIIYYHIHIQIDIMDGWDGYI